MSYKLRELTGTLVSWRNALISVGIFSAAINILLLTGPLFMLQVYDRVLASRSSATLLVLFLIVVFFFGMMGALDHYRGRVLARIGAAFQRQIDHRVFEAVLRQAEHPVARDLPAQGLRDVSAVQSALASTSLGAFFDLPWTPVFITVLFLFHGWMGWFAIASVLLVLGLTILNQHCTREPNGLGAFLSAEADIRAQSARKEIETLRGLGMTVALSQRWESVRQSALAAHMKASDINSGVSVTTKTVRMLLQSAILGLAAWLVLRGELTPGAMIAGSILLGRALAPVEQTVGTWPQMQRALAGWTSLCKLLAAVPQSAATMALPRPSAHLSIRELATMPPGEAAATLQGITLTAGPGDAVAVIGSSAAGKSTLAKVLTGLWPPARGEVRLGGAVLHHYDRDVLGRLLGYLPQDVALFPGTVAENIARFDPAARPEEIVEAAQAAAAHELILSLPKGYDTLVSEGAGRLSGGQRQRIGLARAFYGDPVMLVLDEPNASLDDPGVQALNRAIARARSNGKLVIVMSHRPSALAECNLVLLLDAGRMRAFGPKDEVLVRFVRPPSNVVPGPGQVAER